MKILSLLFVLILIIPQFEIMAEDIVYIKLGKPERCKVVGYRAGSPGYFQVVNSAGTAKSINIMNVEEIKFNIPPDPLKTGSETTTIEAVNAFPEKYIGQKMVFSGCRIGQELERFKDGNYFLLNLTSKGGQYIIRNPSADRIVFVVPKSMAEKMAADLEGGYNWPNCTVSCTIIKLGDCYLAVVNRLYIYNKGGAVGTTYTVVE